MIWRDVQAVIIYVPLSVLPWWVRGAGAILPQTHAFAAERAVLLTRARLISHLVVTSLLGLTVATVVVIACGYATLRAALHRAESRGGIGVVA